MSFHSWVIVKNAGPTFKRHWDNIVSAQLCHALAYEDKAVNTSSDNPANTEHWYNICTTSAQRLRWSDIVQMLYQCSVFGRCLASWRHLPNAGLMLCHCPGWSPNMEPTLGGHLLAHRLRRRPNIEPTLVQRVVFAGWNLQDVLWCAKANRSNCYFSSKQSHCCLSLLWVLWTTSEFTTWVQVYRFCVWRGYSANTSHCAIVGSMLVQRRRRWTNIKPTMAQCLVFAG